MTLAVVSYPELGEADAEWIEALRGVHDPQARQIRAHITLVFPTARMDAAALERHCRDQVTGRLAFGVVLASAEAFPDALADRAHVFLIPREGCQDLVDLHDALYRGPLVPELRRDVPYVPHVTVASKATLEQCAGLVDAIGPRCRIQGRVSALEIVGIGSGAVVSLARIELPA